MQKRYYLDTCIWLDYFLDRKDKFRPLGEWALMCIKQIKVDGGIILYSKVIIIELLSRISREDINRLFNIAREESNLIEVTVSDEQKKNALVFSKIKGLPFADALHSILARDNNAILVTRDIHFEKLLNICQVKSPEELL